MTVIRQIDNDYGTLRGCHFDEMLQKHWGSTHTVKIYREPNKSLGISIVGGKVDLQKSESKTILGIFVKNVVEDSPAGKTGQFKVSFQSNFQQFSLSRKAVHLLKCRKFRPIFLC